MSYLKEEIQAGFTILLAIALLALVVIVISGAPRWGGEVTYRVRFEDATGLEPRAPVRLNGLVVGRVLSVGLAPEDETKVQATIGLKPGTPVFDSAKATVTYLSLIGDYYLAINQHRRGRLLPPGSLIPSERTADFMRLIASTTQLSKSMDQLVSQVQPIFKEENVRELGKALRSVTPLILEIKGLMVDLRSSVNHMDSVIAENREPVAKAVEALRRDLERIDSALASIDRLANGLDKWRQVGGRYADEILLNLVGASENLRALSGELREEPWRLLYRQEEPAKRQGK